MCRATPFVYGASWKISSSSKVNCVSLLLPEGPNVLTNRVDIFCIGKVIVLRLIF